MTTETTPFTRSEMESAFSKYLDLTEQYWQARGAAPTPSRTHVFATMHAEIDAMVARLQAMQNATPVISVLSADPLLPEVISRKGYLSEDDRRAADLAKQTERPLVGDELENAVQKLIAKALEIVMLYPAAVTPARQNRLWTLQYELEQGLAALPED
ncbi:hypothetical protein [Thauera phenylacetica]